MTAMQAQWGQQQTVQGGQGNAGRGGRGRGNARVRNVSMYCWTHGACPHTSPSCNTKSVGQRNDATFETRFDGSTKLVPNL